MSYFFIIYFKVDHIKEIYQLKTLTEEYIKLNRTYENPLQSSLKVSEDDVSFYVYNDKDRTGKLVTFENAGSITSHSSFNTKLQTVFIVHGWQNTYLSPVAEQIKAAFLSLEDTNIIVVGWDQLAQKEYVEAQGSVPSVGAYVGKFIASISESYDYSLTNIVIIGHSLGAHVAGFAGKQLNGEVSTIIGLDPAGPLYFELLKNQRLNENDAKYVLAIHTCAKLLGVNYRVGDADFWPNGGSTQAGCGADVVGTCSHSRSYEYYVESAPSSNFIARECDSYDNYKAGKCKENAKASMGGFNVDTGINGNFYLDTNIESPYALGDTDL